MVLSTILFETVMVLAVDKFAAFVPEVSPRVIVPVPAPVAFVKYTVPALMVVPPV